MKRHLKLIAVVTVVMLALSGFSQARSSGGGGGKSRSGSSGGSSGDSGGGGGGCGSDKSSVVSSDGGYRSSSSGSTSGSGSSAREGSATAQILDCVDSRAETTVRMKATGRSRSYTVYVDFLDSTGQVVDFGDETVSLRANETRRVSVAMRDPSLRSRVADCRVTRVV